MNYIMQEVADKQFKCGLCRATIFTGQTSYYMDVTGEKVADHPDPIGDREDNELQGKRWVCQQCYSSEDKG